MTLLKQSDWAWLAGIIDGEGCLSARRNSKNGYVLMDFALGMTHKKTIYHIHSLVGGTVTHKEFKTRVHQMWNEQWYWHCPIKTAKWILPKLIPHMITKKEQAQLFLAICIEKEGKQGKGTLTQLRRKWQDRQLIKLSEMKGRKKK